MAKKAGGRQDVLAHTPTLTNAKARHRFELLERVECGISLRGGEVKSLRAGKGSLEEAYARFRGRELWLVGMHVDEYRMRGYAPHESRRPRKLLLHRHELADLQETVERKGLTLVPVRLYWTDRGFAKVELALARGRKLHDKRDVEKAKTARREMERATRRR